MNPNKAVVALLILVISDVTANQVKERVNDLFGRFFGSSRQNQPAATCDWLSNPALLKELQWKEQVDLCFEDGPSYQYPGIHAYHKHFGNVLEVSFLRDTGKNDVEVALKNDPAATKFLSYVTQCYNYKNQTYYTPWNQQFYTQDLCPVRTKLVQKVWRHNHVDNKRDHCYIVHPEQQRVGMAQCGDGRNHPDSQKCKRDENSYFQGNYFCVPDGYIQRMVLIYCPWDPEIQCIPAEVRIPTGCSCKQYTCDKGRTQAGRK